MSLNHPTEKPTSVFDQLKVVESHYCLKLDVYCWPEVGPKMIELMN